MWKRAPHRQPRKATQRTGGNPSCIVLLDHLREHFKMEEVPHSVSRHSEGGWGKKQKWWGERNTVSPPSSAASEAASQLTSFLPKWVELDFITTASDKVYCNIQMAEFAFKQNVDDDTQFSGSQTLECHELMTFEKNKMGHWNISLPCQSSTHSAQSMSHSLATGNEWEPLRRHRTQTTRSCVLAWLLVLSANWKSFRRRSDF